MSCEKHPISGVIEIKGVKVCYGCWLDSGNYAIEHRNDKREERMKKFYICCVEGIGEFSHYKYYSLKEAQKEAERLAEATVKTIYLFECVGKCKVKETPAEWEIP